MNNVNRLSVVHIITGLSIGGAEMMLYKLLCATDRTNFDPAVVSLRDRGALGKKIEDLGIAVYTLGINPVCPTPSAFWRLVKLVRRLQPHIIQGWMYHANLAALLAGRFAPNRPPVLWNIRHSPDLKNEKRMTKIMINLGALLSPYPVGILYNSQASARRHKLIGYNTERELIIPNGFDCSRLKPSSYMRLWLRQRLGLDENTVLIGLLARYHPMKDHANFLRAAGKLADNFPDVHFVLAGRDADESNRDLMKMVKDCRLAGRVHLLGEQTDLPEITAGLDIVSLSSAWGEGFPNVIGEAMLCGVPCVVTDVGDSPRVVGNTGIVVPPRDSGALVAAWKALIDTGPEGREQLGKAARKRIVEHFSLPQIASLYESFYRNVACIQPYRFLGKKRAL